jgi:hypothetical protein
MLDSYKIALKHLNFNLNSDVDFQTETGRNSSIEVTATGIDIYDVYNFDDRMDITPHLYNAEGTEDKYLNYWFAGPVNLDINNEYTFVGHKNIQRHKESIIKAMMVALLTNNGKRSTTLSSDSLATKKEVFFNCLRHSEYRNYNARPWNTWRDSVGICTPTSISRSNNVAIVTTTVAHGMTTSFDDWGVIMNLNTGIATSFNISTSTYPNGVPVKIIDANTFSYKNIGINTSTTAVVGTASIQVGWGGSSNNLHLYFS